MRRAYAHEAVLDMNPDGDLRAPGAAVTVELCGAWEHEPPCPLAPHHTRADRDGARVKVRTLFAGEPDAEGHIRDRIDRALSGGELTGPDGVTTTWRLLRSGPSDVEADEADHAGRLTRS